MQWCCYERIAGAVKCYERIAGAVIAFDVASSAVSLSPPLRHRMLKKKKKNN